MNQLKVLCAGALILLLQITLIDLISIHGIKPDLVVLFVISRAITEGPTAGVAWGFGLGILIDTLTGGITGLGTLAYSMAGFLGGRLGFGKVLTRTRYLTIIFSGSALVYFIFTYFLQPWDAAGWMTILLTNTFPGIFYTWIITLVWFYSPFGHFLSGRSRGQL